MPAPIIYHISMQGAEDALGKLQAMNAEIRHGGQVDMKEYRATQQQVIQTSRGLNNENRISNNLWMGMHPNVRRTSEALGVVSRMTGVAMNAMNAYNLAMVAFNTNNANQMEAMRDVKQAERALANLKQTGGSAMEIANATEDIDVLKAKAKELNDQLSQQKMSNMVMFATTIAHMGSSFGHILTKAPDIMSFFRKIGGSFGGGGGGGAGISRPGGGTAAAPQIRTTPGAPGGAGAPGIAVPSGGGGGCMQICEQGQQGIARAISSTAGTKIASAVRSLVPYLIPIGFTAGVLILLDKIKENTAFGQKSSEFARPEGTGNFSRGDRVFVNNPEAQPVPVKVTNWEWPKFDFAPVIVPAPEVTVNVPEPKVTVNVEAPPPMPAPQVTVNVPAPKVTVNVPAQEKIFNPEARLLTIIGHVSPLAGIATTLTSILGVLAPVQANIVNWPDWFIKNPFATPKPELPMSVGIGADLLPKPVNKPLDLTSTNILNREFFEQLKKLTPDEKTQAVKERKTYMEALQPQLSVMPTGLYKGAYGQPGKTPGMVPTVPTGSQKGAYGAQQPPLTLFEKRELEGTTQQRQSKMYGKAFGTAVPIAAAGVAGSAGIIAMPVIMPAVLGVLAKMGINTSALAKALQIPATKTAQIVGGGTAKTVATEAAERFAIRNAYKATPIDARSLAAQRAAGEIPTIQQRNPNIVKQVVPKGQLPGETSASRTPAGKWVQTAPTTSTDIRGGGRPPVAPPKALSGVSTTVMTSPWAMIFDGWRKSADQTWEEFNQGFSAGVPALLAPMKEAHAEEEKNSQQIKQKSTSINAYWAAVENQNRGTTSAVRSTSQNLVSASGKFVGAYGAATSSMSSASSNIASASGKFSGAYGAATNTTATTVQSGADKIGTGFTTGSSGLGTAFSTGTGKLNSTLGTNVDNMAKVFGANIGTLGTFLGAGAKQIQDALTNAAKQISSVSMPKATEDPYKGSVIDKIIAEDKAKANTKPIVDTGSYQGAYGAPSKPKTQAQELDDYYAGSTGERKPHTPSREVNTVSSQEQTAIKNANTAINMANKFIGTTIKPIATPQKPVVKSNDVKTTYSGLSGGFADLFKKAKPFAEGGTIKEPTLLKGLRSGGLGVMAEKGPEHIVPTRKLESMAMTPEGKTAPASRSMAMSPEGVMANFLRRYTPKPSPQIPPPRKGDLIVDGGSYNKQPPKMTGPRLVVDGGDYMKRPTKVPEHRTMTPEGQMASRSRNMAFPTTGGGGTTINVTNHFHGGILAEREVTRIAQKEFYTSLRQAGFKG